MVWLQNHRIVVGWTGRRGLDLQVQMVVVLRVQTWLFLSIRLREHALTRSASGSSNVSVLLILLYSGGVLQVWIRACVNRLSKIQDVGAVARRRRLKEKVVL